MGKRSVICSAFRYKCSKEEKNSDGDLSSALVYGKYARLGDKTRNRFFGGKLPPQLQPASERTLRILVVDDNLDQVHSLAYLLKDDGHQVDFAINATAALDLARRAKPELVLLDIGLPDGNGLKVAGLLRLLPGLAAIRIVAVTGTDVPDAEIRAAGCDAIVRKPIAYGELKAAIDA